MAQPTMKTDPALCVNEIFCSIQGESTYSGLRCGFVRLAGCNLRCSYCDTIYSQQTTSGEIRTIAQICDSVKAFECQLVEVTGGEPLVQEATPRLCHALIKTGYTVLVETNGSFDISVLPHGCVRIMDIKCPGSGELYSLFEPNLALLDHNDECKMIITHQEDFLFALDMVKTHSLHKRCSVIFSPCFGDLSAQQLASWIIEYQAPVRLGLQIHKYIWDKEARGV